MRAYAVTLSVDADPLFQFGKVFDLTPRAAARRFVRVATFAAGGRPPALCVVRVVNDDHVTEFPADAVPE